MYLSLTVPASVDLISLSYPKTSKVVHDLKINEAFVITLIYKQHHINTTETGKLVENK